LDPLDPLDAGVDADVDPDTGEGREAERIVYFNCDHRLHGTTRRAKHCKHSVILAPRMAPTIMNREA
jgi:hypothetical protein